MVNGKSVDEPELTGGGLPCKYGAGDVGANNKKFKRSSIDRQDKRDAKLPPKELAQNSMR